MNKHTALSVFLLLLFTLSYFNYNLTGGNRVFYNREYTTFHELCRMISLARVNRFFDFFGVASFSFLELPDFGDMKYSLRYKKKSAKRWEKRETGRVGTLLLPEKWQHGKTLLVGNKVQLYLTGRDELERSGKNNNSRVYRGDIKIHFSPVNT